MHVLNLVLQKGQVLTEATLMKMLADKDSIFVPNRPALTSVEFVSHTVVVIPIEAIFIDQS